MARGALRQSCLEAAGTRPEDAELRRLESSLKKCTGFLRKLKATGVTEESSGVLVSESRLLNLSRYISEVVTAIAESRLRSSEVDYVVGLCVELHARYEEFSPQLVVALAGVVLANGSSARELPVRRGAMRLLVDIFILGMCTDVSHVINVLRDLMRGARESKEQMLDSLSIIANFTRAASRVFIIKPLPNAGEDNASSGDEDAEKKDDGVAWEDSVLPIATRESVTGALDAYYTSDVLKLLEGSKDALQKAETSTIRSRQTRGTVDDTSAARYEAARQLYERVSSSCTVLAEALGHSTPTPLVFGDDGSAASADASRAAGKDGINGVVVGAFGGGSRFRGSLADADLDGEPEQPYDGEEEREFYTDLPELATRPESEPCPVSDTASSGGDSVAKKNNSVDNVGKDTSSSRKDSQRNDVKVKTTPSSPAGGRSGQGSSGGGGNSSGRRKSGEKLPSFDNLLGRLASTETKESADKFVQSFVALADSTRNASKRLAKTLFTVSAQKLNVLPAFSRIAASLKPMYPDVAVTVAAFLEEEFRFLVGRTDIDEKSLATCVKTARYMGEYVKFQLIEPSLLFTLLGLCMKDFAGHKVDIACHLLESCGRVLYRTASSSVRMGNLLDTLWRLKSVKNLEARHNALVETAFFAAKPSASSRLQRRKIRPPIHEYIRHLIYARLSPSNVRWTVGQMRKLPWDEELEMYVAKKFIKVSRVRFSTISLISSLLAGLNKFRGTVVVAVVDGILEAIRAGMERNDGRDSQRRIAEISLLGELYKVGVVDSGTIYHTLYQCITLGHEVQDGSSNAGRTSGTWATSTEMAKPDGEGEEASVSDSPNSVRTAAGGLYLYAPDPPNDFFRIRLACVLIEACGSTLVAAHRRKLEVFWIFFERYIFCKTAQSGLGHRLPLHMNHVVMDAYERVICANRQPLGINGQGGTVWSGAEESRRGRRGRGKMAKLQRDEPVPKTISRGPTPSLIRSETLEEALEAVLKVEQSTVDWALVSVPTRVVTMPPQARAPGAESEGKTERLPVNGASSVATAAGSGSSVDHGTAETGTVGNDSDDDGYSNIASNSDADLEADEDEDSEDEDDEDDEDDDENDGDEDDDLVDAESDSVDGYGEEASTSDDDEVDEDDLVVELANRRPRTGEEQAFEKELAAFTASAVQSARESSSRVTKLDRMTIPMSLMTKKMESDRAAAAAAAATAASGTDATFDDECDTGSNSSEEERRYRERRARKPASGMQNAVGFKMLVRKGGKSQMHDLAVPSTSSLAVAAKQSESADAARHEEVKRLVLGSSAVINGDEEEENLDHAVPLRTQQDARAKDQSIKEQRSADELALLSTLCKPRRR